MAIKRWLWRVTIVCAVSLTLSSVLVLKHSHPAYIFAALAVSWFTLLVISILILKYREHRSVQAAIPAHYAYLNLSLLLLAIREVWLRRRTSNGVPVEATVELAYHTDPVAKKVFRAEVRYSYIFQGRQFAGRTARDYFLNHKAAEKLAAHRKGEQLIVHVTVDRPEISYYPSGFGFIEPVILAPLILFIALFFLFIPPLLCWAFTYDLFK